MNWKDAVKPTAGKMVFILMYAAVAILFNFWFNQILDAPQKTGFPFAFKTEGCYLMGGCVNEFHASALTLDVLIFLAGYMGFGIVSSIIRKTSFKAQLKPVFSFLKYPLISLIGFISPFTPFHLYAASFSVANFPLVYFFYFLYLISPVILSSILLFLVDNKLSGPKMRKRLFLRIAALIAIGYVATNASFVIVPYLFLMAAEVFGIPQFSF